MSQKGREKPAGETGENPPKGLETLVERAKYLPQDVRKIQHLVELLQKGLHKSKKLDKKKEESAEKWGKKEKNNFICKIMCVIFKNGRKYNEKVLKIEKNEKMKGTTIIGNCEKHLIFMSIDGIMITKSGIMRHYAHF